jgi:hypothetical protein
MDRDDFGSCNTILTERSVEIAKQAVARQFFGTLENRGQMRDMGKGLVDRPVDANIDMMMQGDFTRSLRALKYRQRVIEGKGSRQMKGCLIYQAAPDVGDPQFLAHQEAQYKPYAKGYEENSNVRTYNELKLRRIR